MDTNYLALQLFLKQWSKLAQAHTLHLLILSISYPTYRCSILEHLELT